MNFAGIAAEILEFWNKQKVFERSVSNREGAPAFTFDFRLWTFDFGLVTLCLSIFRL